MTCSWYIHAGCYSSPYHFPGAYNLLFLSLFCWVFFFSPGSKLQWHLCNSLAVIFCCLGTSTTTAVLATTARDSLGQHRPTLEVMMVTGQVGVWENGASKMGLRGEALGRGEGKDPGTRNSPAQAKLPYKTVSDGWIQQILMDVGPGLEGRTSHIPSPFMRVIRKSLSLTEFSTATIKEWLSSRSKENNQFSVLPFSEPGKLLW